MTTLALGVEAEEETSEEEKVGWVSGTIAEDGLEEGPGRGEFLLLPQSWLSKCQVK